MTFNIKSPDLSRKENYSLEIINLIKVSISLQFSISAVLSFQKKETDKTKAHFLPFSNKKSGIPTQNVMAHPLINDSCNYKIHF